MSHEEPDIELPKDKALARELDKLGAELPPGDGVLRGSITWQALLAGALVAVLMGVSYPYMVLKLGFGPNVSVVAAFFGFLFLRVLDLVIRGRHYNRWQNNLVEAAGTSAAQTAFMCVLLGAFDILAFNTRTSALPFKLELTPFTSFLWLTAAATLGVLMAVPLRRHFIVDEKLPYVDGLATGETITVLDPPRDASAEVRSNALKAFWAVMTGVFLSGLVMALREDAKFTDIIPEGWAPKVTLIGGVVLAKLAVGTSYSLLSIGSGMLVGLRINVSMMLGATLGWIVAPYFLITYGVELRREVVTTGDIVVRSVFTDAPTRTEVLFWVMWPATGMLVAGGLAALALRWRILVETFRSLRAAKIDGSEFPLAIVVPGIAISAVALCIIQQQLLGMPIWMTVVAILLSVPLMLVGLRVLGETNWGPISALSNMMQGLFAAVAPGNIGANMVASGTAGTVATSSEMIMQDYKCGDMVGTKPRLLTIMQLLAIPIGAAAVSLIYPVFKETYGIVERVDPATGEAIAAQLTSPISAKWAGFAQLLQDGISALSTSAIYALVIFSVLGVLLTVLESNKKIKKWVPSPTGIGIGILVPFAVVSTMFVGGVIGYIWEKVNKKQADLYMIPLGSGFIAGEALVAVFAALYFFATG
ncbi:MAG: OPT/YSL family transporter [Deltaproteobacteria bacterium]|nr:OPT/YSL family transporter [Deltaproteobacteria bacterium]MDQ3298939.1 OPT/YSL family transporter [Myxococcota bacterium]